MQLHACDHSNRVISAQRAQRQLNYRCLECQQNVRLRRGLHRQPHFYHLEPIASCRQHQKGAVHLRLQLHFFHQLPQGDCQLEVPFPSIGRIADVAWLSQKIVFEIQCSPISAEEALARNRDYQKEGWNVVWILHDQRYNQVRLSALEAALRSSPHFFSNMDPLGNGIIYDQFEFCDRGLRLSRLPPLPIDLKRGIFTPKGRKSFPLLLLDHRSKHWPFFFSGDLMSLVFNRTESKSCWNFFKQFYFWDRQKECDLYLRLALKKEREFTAARNKKNLKSLLLQAWHRGVKHPYQIVFRFLLERTCR